MNLKGEYPDVDYFDETDLIECMQDVYAQKKQSFIVIIDEWDCIFREYKEDKEAQEKYLDFLRDLLKDKSYIHLAYMTGILPIKKYGTHSALNMFDEFSMINPGPLARYVGFTEDEVRMLCEQYHMDMTEMKNWYDGYLFENKISIYSPRSVVSCMRFGKIGNYWNQTETFEALRIYIDMNFEGLKDDVLSMIAGKSVPVNIGSFANDMATFHTEDDVLTLLIHLGYVSYDYDSKTVKIPNKEVFTLFIKSLQEGKKGNEEAMSIRREVLEEIINLAKKYDIDKVILFGSRARGDYKRTSDIDLAVEGGDVASFSLDVEEETTTLLKFDIVDLGRAIQEELRKSIEKEGKIIYEKI